MTKDVWISICGVHYTDEEQDPIQTIASGQYYFRNGKHYVLYEEVLEGIGEKIQNRIKISDQSVEIRKKGASNVHMTFQPGVRNLTSYETPYGPLLMGMRTNSIQLQEKEDSLNVRMEYDLEVEDEDLSVCSMTIEIIPKKGSAFPAL